MTTIDRQLLETELIKQNPWWVDAKSLAIDPVLPKRKIYSQIYNRVVQDNLITAITGLRRIGKTTIVKQIINELLPHEDRNKILFFSMEDSILNKSVDWLETIVQYQLKRFPKEKLFFFLDEIQYVPEWSLLLKKYVDLYPQLKFVVTGSSSLFIKSQARESLAGRILETVMPPLSYSDFLQVAYGLSTPTTDEQKKYFNEYLCWGEFPYLNKLESWTDKKEYLLNWVVSKIVGNDLPKLKRINQPEKLLATCMAILEGSGQLVKAQNFSQDLQISKNTLTNYLYLLEQTYLTKSLLNKGWGFRSRESRQKKIYFTSTNAVVFKNTTGLNSESFDLKLGQIVETFVHNYLSQESPELYFWQERQKYEVDFIQKTADGILPIEVKYKNQIKQDDIKNILYFCKKEKLLKAKVITKDYQNEEKIEGINISFIPAYTLT